MVKLRISHQLWLRASFWMVLVLFPNKTNMENLFEERLSKVKSKFNGEYHLMKIASLKKNNIIIECPQIAQNSVCPCHKFEEGLFLECPGTTAEPLRLALQQITSPIQSLTIYDFDRSITYLSQDVFQPGMNIRHLQFSHSNLEVLQDNSLINIRASLETLSIVNGKLKQVPKNALSGMTMLMALDFDSNEISEIEKYSFHGLHIAKLNMKSNRLKLVPEHAFSGLEDSIGEIDLSDNRLTILPMLAFKNLDRLKILRLSFNQITKLNSNSKNEDSIRNIILHSLISLDLSSNNFEEIINDEFQSFPKLNTLSLYSNQIEIVHKNSFQSLKDLLFLDLSRNRIIYVDSKFFENNKRLQTVDLSYNHIHSISGVFSNLPSLREIFLSENYILELQRDVFTNSTNIDVIYLESNAINYVDPMVFNTLGNLKQLYLRSNFISQIPVTLLDKTLNLTSLSLDDNKIENLEVGMFRKLKHLKEIRLHNNQIKRIFKGAFYPLPSLQELHLQKNLIEEIETNAFSNMLNLQYINLQNNQLTFIGDIFPNSRNRSYNDKPFENTSHLLSIQLNMNLISNINERALINQKKIQVMWLSDNCLEKINALFFQNAWKLERCYLSNNQIKYIETNSFQASVELKILDLSGNRLNSISRDYFATLKLLEELNLSDNKIGLIDGYSFKNLKKLKILDLSNNPLIEIKENTFQNDLFIKSINLRNCLLRKIETNSFYGLTNLNEINLENNYLTSKDIYKLDIPSLRNLKLSNNNFSDIDIESKTRSSNVILGMFDKLLSLQQLSIANCSLKQIPEQLFSRNTNLVKLDLNGNEIRALKRNVFNNLNLLKELHLDDNQLNDYPYSALYNITTLEILSISQNFLINIDFFKVSGTPNIHYLDIQGNTITTLQGFHHAINLTQLDFIDLSGNLLMSLPTNFLRHAINLQRIDLSNNRFFQIPSSALSDTLLSRLSLLNLNGNPIDKIYLEKEENYPYLKELYLCQTNLSILISKDFQAFQQLQHLHLTQNHIVRISPGAFNTLSNLLTLDLSENEVEIIPKERLQGLKSLRILNISHNSLKDLEEFSSDLKELLTLDLSYNQLTKLSQTIFYNLKKIGELNLRRNRIAAMSLDTFKSLRKLFFLDLRENSLKIIPVEAFKLLETNLRNLRIEENPLHCICDSQELWEWLRNHPKWTIDDHNYNLKCEQPGELRGKLFLKMEPQQFCDASLILKLEIQDIQENSVAVTWESRDHSVLEGYQIVYREIDDDIDKIHVITVNVTTNSVKLHKLLSNTKYLLCILGTGNWSTPIISRGLSFAKPNFNKYFEPNILNYNNNNNETIISMKEIKKNLIDSETTKCVQLRTLESTQHQISDENALLNLNAINSILTRRLGLIVGFCLGIVVFILLIFLLSYIKVEKRRLEELKNQSTIPPVFTTYAIIPNEEIIRNIGGPCSTSNTASTLLGNENNNPNQSQHHHEHRNNNYLAGVVLGANLRDY